ncbi:hypothetical protein ACFVZD_43655 [Streptomyces sp. NPDC058287]|uniref:hypothetical protein n=1 Tax=unclassified Streptomyces TaxID=2593676 RepID=UPI0036ED680B
MRAGFDAAHVVAIYRTAQGANIDKATAVIEEAWDLLPGSVVVDSGSGTELWVYQRPSATRHHRLRPMSVGSRRGQQASAG